MLILDAQTTFVKKIKWIFKFNTQIIILITN